MNGGLENLKLIPTTLSEMIKKTARVLHAAEDVDVGIDDFGTCISTMYSGFYQFNEALPFGRFDEIEMTLKKSFLHLAIARASFEKSRDLIESLGDDALKIFARETPSEESDDPKNDTDEYHSTRFI
jgi:hypothetical protein